jgi:L-ascorbate metabolism protein UlaG (beta-lactamase superfamily)
MKTLKQNLLLLFCLFVFIPSFALNKAGINTVFSLNPNEIKAMNSDNNINPAEGLKEPLKSMVENIHWYGQSSIRIPFNGKLIYIDPFQITEKDPAALILITHPHFDHFSVDEISKVATHTTPIYAPKECNDKLRSLGYKNCVDVVPGQSFNVGDIKFETVPSYNTIKNNHPKDKHWVGYVLTLGTLKIYHPGDTNRIPEMKAIHCDIAFMPLGQTYTMQNVQEAADAVMDVKAKVAIPIHYGIYEGASTDAPLFKQLLANKVWVVIKEPLTKLKMSH